MGPENQLPNAICRLRLTFTKEGATRYISHLDLARALERSLNRARLPVAYTQGFNRRPRLSLAAALPLGYTSEAELADVWLTDSVNTDYFQERLRLNLAPGISVSAVTEVPLTAPSLQQQMAESVYEVYFDDWVDESLLVSRAEEIIAATTLPRERSRSKGNQPQTFDLRPLVLGLHVRVSETGRPLLEVRLVHTANQTGKPDDVLAAMRFDPLDARVHRIGLRFASPDAAAT